MGQIPEVSNALGLSWLKFSTSLSAWARAILSCLYWIGLASRLLERLFCDG